MLPGQLLGALAATAANWAGSCGGLLQGCRSSSSVASGTARAAVSPSNALQLSGSSRSTALLAAASIPRLQPLSAQQLLLLPKLPRQLLLSKDRLCLPSSSTAELPSAATSAKGARTVLPTRTSPGVVVLSSAPAAAAVGEASSSSTSTTSLSCRSQSMARVCPSAGLSNRLPRCGWTCIQMSWNVHDRPSSEFRSCSSVCCGVSLTCWQATHSGGEYRPGLEATVMGFVLCRSNPTGMWREPLLLSVAQQWPCRLRAADALRTHLQLCCYPRPHKPSAIVHPQPQRVSHGLRLAGHRQQRHQLRWPEGTGQHNTRRPC